MESKYTKMARVRFEPATNGFIQRVEYIFCRLNSLSLLLLHTSNVNVFGGLAHSMLRDFERGEERRSSMGKKKYSNKFKY